MAEPGFSYAKDNRFSAYYFEDSYVLRIEEDNAKILFELELVLTPDHAEYQPPPSSVQHCYRRARLVFDNLKSVHWKRRSRVSFVDGDGERDLGNIDSFTIFPNNEYKLEGDWGDLELVAGTVSIELV